jgi:cytochrome c peroxidase
MTLIRSVLCAAALCAAAAAIAAERDAFRRPLTIPFPPEAPYAPLRAALGKLLFFDPRVSGAQNMSCASCHNPSFGWEVPTPGPIGAQNTMLARQAPTILNAAWGVHFFFDGRAKTLEDQAVGPITAEVEMNAELSDVVARLGRIGTYAAAFAEAYPGEGLTIDTMLNAIATYERTVVAGWAPFDRWVEGEEDAISAAARRGFALFVGKARCADCHGGWNFTDDAFHDIGLDTDDIGRAMVEPDDPLAMHAIKTPSLRNIEHRGPFMHDGSLATLEDVMAHYVSGGLERPSRAPQMGPVDLSFEEMEDVIAFMRSLTAYDSAVPTPQLPTD